MKLALLETATTITFETLNQPVDPIFTQILATYYDWSKSYNLRQFSVSLVQK